MMKKSLIIILLILSFNNVSAQVSGYMGNKFSVIYSSGISLPHVAGAIGNSNDLYYILNHAVELDYVITNRTSIGLSYKYASSLLENSRSFVNESFFVPNHKFSSHSFGLHYKITKKNLAPLGFYYKPSVYFQYLLMNDIILIDYKNSSNYKAVIKDYKQFDFAVNMAIGKNWLLFDRVFIGIELKSGIPIASIVRSVFFDSETSIDSEIGVNTAGSIYTSKINVPTELLQLKLNVGFLAF
ncbi:MAG: hypothetical protein ACPGVH_00565 [Chitinophagales bacterium]